MVVEAQQLFNGRNERICRSHRFRRRNNGNKRVRNPISRRILPAFQGVYLAVDRGDMRLTRFLKLITRTQDFSAALLLGFVLAISTWLILMPFNKQVQQATMLRFHLQSKSFIAWCGLQVVPSMYNLENRYWLTEVRQNSDGKWTLHKVDSGMANHFPTRMLTSYDARYRFYGERRQTEMLLESRFQNRALVTKWRVERQVDNSLIVTQEPTN